MNEGEIRVLVINHLMLEKKCVPKLNFNASTFLIICLRVSDKAKM